MAMNRWQTAMDKTAMDRTMDGTIDDGANDMSKKKETRNLRVQGQTSARKCLELRHIRRGHEGREREVEKRMASIA
jgi:hypothetical protein